MGRGTGGKRAHGRREKSSAVTELLIPEFACILAVSGKDRCDARAFLRRVSPKAVILSLTPYRVEFSDDPCSPEAMRGAFQMLKNEMERYLSSGREVGIDCEDLRDDQVNQLRKLVPRHFVSGARIDLTPAHMSSVVTRAPPPTDRKAEQGPFDAVGDVHGCMEELLVLLSQLGYGVTEWLDADGSRRFDISNLHGRRLLFLGDLADRGPDNVGPFALVMDACASGVALCVIGNHDGKALRWFDRIASGKDDNVSDAGGFDITRAQLLAETPAFRHRLHGFLDSLPSHYLLENGDLCVAHAGILENMQGRDSPTLTAFCMFGDTKKGDVDEHGLPVRGYWAQDYHGAALVLHGHTPVPEPLWGPQGNVCCIDTGCVFGGRLTALRWPELEFVSVPAGRAYARHPYISDSGPDTDVATPGLA